MESTEFSKVHNPGLPPFLLQQGGGERGGGEGGSLKLNIVCVGKLHLQPQILLQRFGVKQTSAARNDPLQFNRKSH